MDLFVIFISLFLVLVKYINFNWEIHRIFRHIPTGMRAYDYFIKRHSWFEWKSAKSELLLARNLVLLNAHIL